MQILVLREVRWNDDGDLTSEGELVTYLGGMSTRKESCSWLKELLLIVSPAWEEMEQNYGCQIDGRTRDKDLGSRCTKSCIRKILEQKWCLTAVVQFVLFSFFKNKNFAINVYT